MLEVWWLDVMSCSWSGWSWSVVAVVGRRGVLQLLWLVVVCCSYGGYLFFSVVAMVGGCVVVQL